MGKQQAGLRVFVMGCSRGGTTIAQRSLSERLNPHTLPETRFFSNLIGNAEERLFPSTARPRPLLRQMSSGVRERLGRGTGREHVHVNGLDLPPGRKWASVRATTDRFVTALDRTARNGGHSGWLEKSPSHTHFAPEIHRLVPDAWMIHIVRDPQDNIASIWDAAKTYSDPWGIIYDRVERAADKWSAATRTSASMVGRPRQIFVSYDAFASDVEGVLGRIADILDLPLVPAASPDTSAADRTNARLAGTDEHWKAGALGAAVCPAQSKWNSVLSEAERDAARRKIGSDALDFFRRLTDLGVTTDMKQVA